ncbi:MAG: hypothetical protein H0T78_02730 [Longispora sp.]|nr:hypothetical protein [Longispora sp. (in: high G+C Gram-positive bacteria)]
MSVLSEADRATVREDLRYWHASVLVLDTRTNHAEALRATVNELVGPGKTVADVYLWDVRSLVG